MRELPIRELRYGLACATLLLGAAVASGAQPAGEPAARLTLREAVERALSSYPAVAAARNEREAAAHRLGEAEASKLPTIAAGASGIHYDKPAVVTPIHGFSLGTFPDFDRDLVQGAITLDYAITDGGQRAGSIRQRGALLAAADAALDGAEQATAARVAITFLRTLTLENTLAAHELRITALEAERQRVSMHLEVGRAAEVELRRVEAALAAARAERERIVATLDTARGDLGRFIGEEPASLAPLALSDRQPPSSDALREAALAASPDVLQATQALAASEAALTVVRALHRPKLRAIGRVLELGSAAGNFETEWNAGLMLSVPLFEGGAATEREAAASAARDAAAERLRLAQLAAEADLDRALAALRESRARVSSLEEAVGASREVVRIEKLRREAGVGIETDYLSAEADLLAARAQLGEAGNAEIAARVELARITGSLDLAWIDRSLEPADTSPGESQEVENEQ